MPKELQEIHIQLSGYKQRLLSLENYQKVQNGHLQDIRKKIDLIYKMLIGILGSLATGVIILLLQNGG